MSLAPIVLPNDDDPKNLPTEYVGHPIVPNYYCRGWNGKRKKYCKARAGAKTDHPGVGRCSVHGGTKKLKHGLRRRYKSSSSTIAKLLDQHGSDEAPLETIQEIQVTRALFQKYLNDNPENPEPDVVLRFVAEITKMVERVITARAKNAISYPQLKSAFFQVDRIQEGIVRKFVKDLELADTIMAGIREELRGIRV